MIIKILKGYIKDRLKLLLTIIGGFLFLLTYNSLQYDQKVVFYPYLVIFFIIFLGFVIDFLKYYKFSISIIEKYGNDIDGEGLENSFIDVLDKLQEEHFNEKVAIEQKYKEEKHFLSQWIHNMKTPINVMELCQEQKKSISNNLDKGISEELDRLNNMLNMTLHYIRIGDFKEDFVPEKIDLIISIRNCINHHKNNFIYHNCYPITNFTTENAYIYTDRKWNEFMITQIIANSIKYSFQEKSRVIFRITKEENQIKLIIEDQGIGIPEKDLGRICDPFFTGDNGRKTADSTGIGLYLTQKIADSLGHQLNISSTQGKGTKVVLSYLTEL